MRYLMRHPLPDEFMSSMWIRSARRAGLPLGVATFAMTGRKWYPGFFQGGHLRDIAPFVGKSAEQLLLEHTAFPYASAFLTPAARGKCLASALASSVQARATAGLTQSVSDLVRHRRWCPMCAAADFEANGESYWRRSHNLPGVVYCLLHRCSLLESQIPMKATGPAVLKLPHELKSGQPLCELPGAFEKEVARIAVKLLHEPYATGRGSADGYRAHLETLGVLSAGRQIALPKLRDLLGDIRNHAAAFGLHADLAELALLLRPGVKDPSIAAKHVFLQAGLSGVRTVANRQLDHRPTGCTPRPRGQEDQHLARNLRALAASHEQQGTTVRVSDALSGLGCWGSFRHNRDRYPQLSAEVLRLRKSSASARQVEEKN